MIGDKLRRERERLGLSAKDVEQGTSIRALYIEAIENGDWAALPGEVYAKGFVRNYANFLKLDGDACVAEYVSDTGSVMPAIEESREAAVVSTATLKSGNDFNARIKKERRRQNMLMAAMALIVILGGAYLIFGMSDDKQVASNRVSSKTSHPAKTESGSSGNTPAPPVTVPTPPAPTPSAAPTKPATPAPSANNNVAASAKKSGDVEITAKLNDRCWLKVVADGQTVYEGTAEKGKTLSWKGSDRITITAGNAGALELTHNGKNVGQAGDYGEVVNKVFTKESAN